MKEHEKKPWIGEKSCISKVVYTAVDLCIEHTENPKHSTRKKPTNFKLGKYMNTHLTL